jgi:ribosome-binding factor A
MNETVERRLQRVEREIKEILSNFFIRKYRQDFRGLLSVSNVKITKDLKQARVYVSTLGQSDDSQHNFDFIHENRGHIQRELGKNLKAKFCPKIEFFEDSTLEESSRIQNILSELRKETRDFGDDIVSSAEQGTEDKKHV